MDNRYEIFSDKFIESIYKIGEVRRNRALFSYCLVAAEKGYKDIEERLQSQEAYMRLIKRLQGELKSSEEMELFERLQNLILSLET